MPFLHESEPRRGVAAEIMPGIRRLVANNPGVMTYHGTNTYLLDGPEGLTVLDPGPDDPAHVRDILAAAAGAPIAHILLTHTHSDHSGASAALRAASGATIHACKTDNAPFMADQPVADGDTLAGLRAIHTPGHAADHLCFALRAGGDSILFSGDHVMSWSSSIVNPPDGDMRHYYRSLRLLLDRDDNFYLPGHGPPLPEPRPLVEEMLAHRQRREAGILASLRGQAWSVGELAAKLYAKTDFRLRIAAQRNVLAHFLKLRDEGIITEIEAAAEAPDLVPGSMGVDALRRFALRPVA